MVGHRTNNVCLKGKMAHCPSASRRRRRNGRKPHERVWRVFKRFFVAWSQSFRYDDPGLPPRNRSNSWREIQKIARRAQIVVMSVRGRLPQQRTSNSIRRERRWLLDSNLDWPTPRDGHRLRRVLDIESMRGLRLASAYRPRSSARSPRRPRRRTCGWARADESKDSAH